jgi:hypothetical protein
MHKIKVLIVGSKNFNTSIEELKDYFNFKLTILNSVNEKLFKGHDVLLIHENYFIKNKVKNDLLQNIEGVKILVSNKTNNLLNVFNEKLSLPVSITDLNTFIETSIAKKSFNKNSSIEIKDYILNKNEKKLFRDGNFIVLTEKEIQLLELFLNNDKSISKSKILEVIWKYSPEADTHTVQTHIYRLRRKIKSKFLDEKFILSNKSGYSL